tara:strand:- start:19578 stop:20756 length:1179 start_codon:yes stop_codon:yes gene_type:complete
MILLLILSKILNGQCDLELLDFDPVAGDITVAFNNTENCGGLAAPTGIAEVQFGFQALDSNCNAMNQGWDFPWGLSIPDDSNHPGWIYSATTTTSSTNWTNLDVWNDYNVDPPYYTGDTITFPLDDFYQAGSTSLYSNLINAFDFWINQGFGIQAVIWQISYGPTIYSDNGGWAEVGGLGGGITPDCCGLYEDSNWQDNWIITCPDDVPEVIYVYDTVYVELPPDSIVEYVYDTTYVELSPDTVYVLEIDTVVQYDTISVPINWYFYDTTYIYVTDTFYTYQYDIVEVDCSTGQYCSTPFEDCSIYIPNSFTPDNDGVNDAWGVVTDPNCWISWRLVVVSRSGEVIWESLDPEEVWLGGEEYYVPSDVYVYRVECEGYGESYIVNGHVTVVR